jgi:hypothetical protein
MLSNEQITASLLVAQKRLSATRIAEKLQITRRTLFNWRSDPEFRDAVYQHRNAWRKHVQTCGIADQELRVYNLNNLMARYVGLIRARAKMYGATAEGRTGLSTRKYRTLHVGPETCQVVEEWKHDAALVKMILNLQKQAAIEMGQWQSKREVSVTFSQTSITLAKVYSPEQLEQWQADLQQQLAAQPSTNADLAQHRPQVSPVPGHRASSPVPEAE